jgi:hypothetical protein
VWNRDGASFIHNFLEIPFFAKFQTKITNIFCLIFTILFQAWHLKTIILVHKIVFISQGKILPNTCIKKVSEHCEWGTRCWLLTYEENWITNLMCIYKCPQPLCVIWSNRIELIQSPRTKKIFYICGFSCNYLVT